CNESRSAPSSSLSKSQRGETVMLNRALKHAASPIAAAIVMAATVGTTVTSTAHAGSDSGLAPRESWTTTNNGWRIEYIPKYNACSMARPHDNGVYLQIVYIPEMRGFALGLYNPKWTYVQDGADYQVYATLDGTQWQGAMRGTWNDAGQPGLVLVPLSKEFLV